MEALSQKLNFSGSLNTDVDLKMVKVGDYIEGLNFRNIYTENGIDGSAENISSNIQVPFIFPGGTNKCIGVYEDVVNYTTFYFIWNSNDAHIILRYFPENTTADKIQVILSESILNFSEWGYITHINLVGNLFYWTQGDNPQRYINVDKANNYQKLPKFKICFEIPVAGAGESINYHFTNVNGGATIPATTVVFSNTETTRAELAQILFTTLSIIPAITNQFDLVNQGDYVEFTEKILPAGYSSTTITITQVTGTTSSWYVAENWYPFVVLKTLDPVVWPLWLEPTPTLINDTTRTTNLLNGKSYQFRVRIYGTDGRVSVLSKDSEMIYFNLFTIPVNGFAKYIINYLDYQQSPTAINAISINFKDNGRLLENRELISSVEILVRNLNTEIFRSVAIIQDYELNGLYTFYNDTIGTAVSQNDDSKPCDGIPVYSETQEVVNNKLFYGNNTVGYDNIGVSADVACNQDAPVWDTKMNLRPKYFGKYNLGVVYFDRLGRNSFVQRTNALTLNILPPYQLHPYAGDNRPICSWAINSQPPEWATHYAWVRTKDLNYQFYEYAAYDNNTITYTDQGGTTVTWGSGNVKRAIVVCDVNFVYTFTKGDLIKFIIFQSSGSHLYDYSFDVEVISFSGHTMTIEYNQGVNKTSTGAFIPDIKSIPSITQAIAQVYTPHRATENESYYEFSECYEVGDSGLSTRYHKGGFQGTNQIYPTQAAEGIFYSGWDTFHIGNNSYNFDLGLGLQSEVQSDNLTITRTLSQQANTAFISNQTPTKEATEITNISDVQTTQIYTRELISGIGRPNAVIVTNKQVFITENICFSNPYNIGTNYNGFGSFELLNNANIPAGYGGINKLLNVENILLAVCVSKTFSIYVDKGILQTNPGDVLVSSSATVLGAIRYLEGASGTVNPESFAVVGSLAFWWNAYSGEVCQYSANGIEIVSRFGRKNYFAQKGAIGIRANRTTYKVLGAIHGQFNEYLMAFNEITVDSVTYPAETFGYSYLKNGWNPNYSYIPEMIVGSGVNLVTFTGGNLYIHKPNASKNTFYGVAYPWEVTVVVNAFPSSSKSFLSISVEGNGAPNIPVITTPITDWNLAGQLSELLSTDFELMNGSYFAGFFMNRLTPNFVSQAMALINGEPLQAQTMTLKFSKTGTTLQILKSAECYFIPDQLTNG